MNVRPVLLLALLAGQAAAQSPARPDDNARYEVDEQVLIHTQDGAALSALLVRRKDAPSKLATILTFDIYADPAAHLALAKAAADRGYAGVVADTRGKRLSPDPIVPYEHEVADTYAVIDWIAHQPWSNGKIGMRGGSYSGFSAWAATKKLHPALKTIAVSAAAMPGYGLPMSNNIFLNANYGWVFYVGDNKLLDEKVYGDAARWQRLAREWFSAGRRYRDIDKVDGTPNPLLQRWLDHPAFDKYWQGMVPYEEDFARLKIPVLTITGYYDDAQTSALKYLKQHYQFNANAEHYLVIGPYDHAGSHAAEKTALLRGYGIDRAAQFSTPDLTYAWMDYVLRGGAKPALLADKVNYEVMGADEWHHAESLQQMSTRESRWYFSDAKDREGNRYKLATRKAAFGRPLTQSIDLKDRIVFNNAHSYPAPIIEEKLDNPTELAFESEPLLQDEIVAGAFSGELDIVINKKDVDLGVTIFEQMPDGKLMHLASWLGRASYASNNSERQLLIPGKNTRIAFETSVTARKMPKGSRLLVLLDVNKNPWAQVNYGTGKEVSEESIEDAGVPLQVQWRTDGYLSVPLEH